MLQVEVSRRSEVLLELVDIQGYLSSFCRMLQLAGVQCAGNPHFWVNDDGSYQEEGQKNTRGYVWGKVWFLCDYVFLPCVLYPIYLSLTTQFFMLLFRLERSLFVLSCHCLFLLKFQILAENK